MPFLMAGDPDLETTAKILLELQAIGADMIELGIPYSDPLADGPIIQLAASRALSAGTSPDRVFKMLSELRDLLTIPIILFTVGFSIIFIVFGAASTFLGQVLLKNSFELRIVAGLVIIILSLLH